jgi:hypothetical protein
MDALLSLSDTSVLLPLDPRLTALRPAQPSDYDALEEAMTKAKLFDLPR